MQFNLHPKAFIGSLNCTSFCGTSLIDTREVIASDFCLNGSIWKICIKYLRFRILQAAPMKYPFFPSGEKNIKRDCARIRN